MKYYNTGELIKIPFPLKSMGGTKNLVTQGEFEYTPVLKAKEEQEGQVGKKAIQKIEASL